MIQKIKRICLKLFRCTPLITRRHNNLIFQYIEDAQDIVISTVGIDPVTYPVLFQKQLHTKIDEINLKLEKLKEGYSQLISKDSQFGETLKNYDFWCKRRDAWLVQKKVKIDLVKKQHMKI